MAGEGGRQPLRSDLPRGRLLITGASGFIGGALVRALARRGYKIRAVYRRRQIPRHLRATASGGVELRRLDLTRPDDRREAVRDVEGVIHAAGLVGDWGRSSLFKAQNYDLTVGLLNQARESGCRIFVYVSSIAVHGFGRHRYSREEGPYYAPIHPYQITKKLAEDYVLARNSPSLKTTAFRPGNVYGPGDTGTFYPILAVLERGIMGYLGDGHSLTCPVYIDDLIAALLLGLERPESAGQVFNITGGEEVTWKQLLEHAAGLLGAAPPRVRIPRPLAYSLAWSLSGFYRFFRLRSAPPITRYRVDQLTYDYHFSIEKARRVLGYRPRVGWQEGFRQTVAAYRKEGRSLSPPGE